ncbi:hypothetical protein LDENG_00215390 [Lucifuga dentata]|nr:hypothetical protein LDENG_00215390 [Lucifuga dentata]
MFELNPSSYSSEREKVAMVTTHLAVRAREWGTTEWDRQSAVCRSFQDFSATLHHIFDHSTLGREAAQVLLQLYQDRGSAVDYAIRFCTLAANSSWNNDSLTDTFLHGLAEDIKDHLTPLDLPADLDSLISLAIKIDNRLSKQWREHSRRLAPLPMGWQLQFEFGGFLELAPSHFQCLLCLRWTGGANAAGAYSFHA